MHPTTELHRPDIVWLVRYTGAAFGAFALYVWEMVQTAIGSPESLSLWSAHWLTNTTSPVLGLLSFRQASFLSAFPIFVTDNPPSLSPDQLWLFSPFLYYAISVVYLHSIFQTALPAPHSISEIGSSYIVWTGLELVISCLGLPCYTQRYSTTVPSCYSLPNLTALVLGSFSSPLTHKHSSASWPALLRRIPTSPYVLN